MALKGRPRLAPEEYDARLKAYCGKYSVKPTPEGIPPFPSGRRETAQHREWLGLYKAHSRLQRHAEGSASIAPQRDRCPLCNASLKTASADVLERARAYLADGSSTLSPRKQRRK
jgi:hypothetical protein